jgi:hypothetical protein
VAATVCYRTKAKRRTRMRLWQWIRRIAPDARVMQCPLIGLSDVIDRLRSVTRPIAISSPAPTLVWESWDAAPLYLHSPIRCLPPQLRSHFFSSFARHR